MEKDEAGRLKAFRNKFGRGWDQEGAEESDAVEGGEAGKGHEDSLMDLISGGSVMGKTERLAGEKAEVEMVTVKKDGVLVKVPAKKKAGSR